MNLLQGTVVLSVIACLASDTALAESVDHGVRLERIDVLGAMDREIVQRYFIRRGRALIGCLPTPTLPMPFRLTVRFEISRTGLVSTVRATGSEAPRQVLGCVERTVRRWRFPAGNPPGINRITVHFMIVRNIGASGTSSSNNRAQRGR